MNLSSMKNWYSEARWTLKDIAEREGWRFDVLRRKHGRH